LRIAQGFDEGFVVGPGESEHGLSFAGTLSKPQLISAGCLGCTLARGTLITCASTSTCGCTGVCTPTADPRGRSARSRLVRGEYTIAVGDAEEEP
jgi:hypothetical protein